MPKCICTYVLFYLFPCLFEPQSYYIAQIALKLTVVQAGLKLIAILLPQSHKYSDCRHEPQCLAIHILKVPDLLTLVHVSFMKSRV